MDLKQTVHKTIQSRNPPLMVPGDRILVAVSGGPDSLALLHILIDSKEDLGISWLGAAHADHGLRGDESDQDREFVESFCSERNVPCITERIDVAAILSSRGLGLEEAARTGRYDFLKRAALSTGAHKVATAHTQDDRIETILFNIIRGTGLEGLKGIPYRRDLYIRPLLDATRTAIEEHCTANQLTPRTDSSNTDTTISTRNRIRRELLPDLERNYNSGVRRALLSLSDIAARDSEYLIQTAEELLSGLSAPCPYGGIEIDGAALLQLHPSLQRHVLRSALTEVRGSLDMVGADGLEAVIAALRNGRPFCLTTPLPHTRLLVKPGRIKIVNGLSDR